jgi:DNA repair protein SbcD/Mre11
MKALFVGDVHYSGKNPVSRLDNYSTAILLKLLEISKIAKDNKVSSIFFTGDIFHSPVISISDFVKFHSVFKTAFNGLKCYIIPGNHDIFGYNIETLARTSLHLLSLCLENVIILSDAKYFFLEDTIISTQHYCNELDVDGFGYSPNIDEDDIANAKKIIHIVHGMLLPNKPLFEKYTLIKDVNTLADIVICGHYHPGWKTIENKGTLFINNGSICRRDASTKELEREVKVTLVDTIEDIIKAITLTSAKPGIEVLSREHLELTDSQKNINEFNEFLQEQKLSRQFVNIGDMIQYMSKKSNIGEEVTKYAVSKIEQKLVEIGDKDVQ